MDTTPILSTSASDHVERRSVSRTRWAAIGAAVAVTLGGGTLALVTAAPATPVMTGADSVAYDVSYFVPITPCRLLDTRATSTVGPRSTPIGAGEVLTVDVTGVVITYGQCNIPAGATAILINITAVSPTANGFLTLYASDVDRPNASNLNFVAGQAPTPNLVNVELSTPAAPGQSFNIFNSAGTVNVIGDVSGYYVPVVI